MAATSAEKSTGPPRKRKQPTQTTKAHRFEPFSKRVARLRIDPVHTVQKSRVTDSSDDLSQSYFKNALDEWAELNLSRTFTTFYNQIHSLAESLPQVLYHADTIATALLKSIEKSDPLALEALLSLVAHFAHDLGQAFEKYFERTVSTVLKLPNNQEDPAVVEWCFTCLAWIYKYLSRLLVNDLCPLLNIVLPYFSARKDYVRRFTAESIAFLIRKAAVTYSKNKNPLTCALEHVFAKITSTNDEQERNTIRHTVSVLLAESAIGVDAKLHSSAMDLLRCAFAVLKEQTTEQTPVLDVIGSTFVNLIHRTDAVGFAPLEDLVLSLDDTNSLLSVRMRFLALLVLTRRGSRVSDWSRVIRTLIASSAAGSHNVSLLPIDLFLQSSAAIVQYAPLNELLPNLTRLLKHLAEVTTRCQFFAFSDLVSQLGRQRFDDLLLPFLQDYIQHTASAERDDLCLHINKLCVSDEQSQSKPVQFPTSLSAKIVAESADFPTMLIALYLTRVIQFPGTPSQRRTLSTQLHHRVEAAMKSLEAGNDSIDQLENRVMLGWGLQSLLDMQHDTSSFADLQKIMNSIDHRFFSITPFVQACTLFLNNTQQAPDRLDCSHAQKFLIENLRNEDIELRTASLKLLLAINQPHPEAWLKQVYDVLFEILETSYSISNARKLAMLVRRLPFLQNSSPRGSSLHTMIPVFCLGLLSCYHDQLHRDVCEVLAQMTTSADVEEIVFSAVREWLESPDPNKSRDDAVLADEDHPLTTFDCSNVRDVQSRWQSAVSDYENASNLLFTQADKVHMIHSLRPPPKSRNVALQTLLHMPELAEKRSKAIVPAFLAAQKYRTSSSLTEDADSDHTLSQELDDQGWSLRERKLFLELLSKFQNPKVLYRQADVYAQLLDLLQNGDPATRRLSLLALLKWKDRAVSDNQEILMKVADDKTSTVELGTMLHAENESSPIKAGTRESVLPILLRLVFGQLIGRVGVAGSQESKRKSLLRLLFRMPAKEIDLFLSLVLGRLKDVSMAEEDHCKQHLISPDLISFDQQYGFLRMCHSMMEILQTQFAPFGAKILDAVLYCTARACHRANTVTSDESIPALVRNIRKAGIQVLDLVFRYCTNVAWVNYRLLVFDQIVDPRLQNFAIENAQSVSTLLRMFATWTHSHELSKWLTAENEQLLPAISSLLSHSLTKDIVKLFVIEEIVAPLVDRNIGEPNDSVLNQSQLDLLLSNIAELLQAPASKPLLLETAKIVSKLAASDAPSELQAKTIELLIGLLDQQNSKLPPHIKGQILEAIERCVTHINTSLPEAVRMRLWNKVSAYLDFFKDKTNRRTCCTILSQSAAGQMDMVLAAEICNDLNAYSTSSLDDIDHDRISTGFGLIMDKLSASVSRDAHLPVLHNLIFSLRTNEDISVRSNALSCLRHLINNSDGSSENSTKLATENILLSAIRKNLKNPSETVRADFVILLGAVVEQDHRNDADKENLSDLKPLLLGGDQEASFFNNILHIQVHRRTRALKRLTDTIAQGQISANHIAEYLLPLVEAFAEDQSADESSQNTKGQSIAALAVILKWLDWKTFRKILRHYKQGLDSASEDSKSALRLLAHAADALTAAKRSQLEDVEQPGVSPFLASSLPSADVLAEELKSNLIPRLTEFSHYKDEEEISVRLPAAVVAIKFIGLLSEADILLLASPIVLDVAQILRSRTQETRDMARKVLAEIVALLGSQSIQFVLKELRTALTRGYQLHVLSYTLHTILLVTADDRQPGDLDYCITDLVKVIMDDIFGTTGQDKDNQDYISSMKEVKSSKSFDSMEILARNTSVHHLSKLVLPFESLFKGSLTTKQLRHADDLLRRIGVGISHNPYTGSQDLLIFTYELIQEFYKSKRQVAPAIKTNDQKNRERFLVQVESSNKTTQSTSAALLYKLAKFAIDVARSSFSRHPELMKAENVQGFLPILGDALVDGQNDVKISALRLLTTVIKLPINELDKNAKLYVLEAVKVVKAATSTNEESAQAALKLVSSIIRDRRSVEVRDSDIAYLLKRTMPDLEEPDRQGVTFNFVKAVMARKMQLPEVYELVDKIGIMMVTSQSRSSREAARGVYVHFLLDYPKSKTRWAKQMKFMLKNLEYQYPEGRQCVMEATNILLNKLERNTASEFASVVFLPVVLRMANDDNERCRELASALLSQVFRKTSEDDLSDMIEPLRAWLAQSDNMELKKVSMQAWSKFFDLELPNAQAEAEAARKAAHSLLKRHNNDEDNNDSEWENKFQSLELLSVLATHHPEDIFSDKQSDLWVHIRTLLSSPQPWLQSSAMNLLGLFFRECISAGSVSVPLACSHGLAFDTTAIIQTVRSCMGILKRSNSEELVGRTVQNVLFLARCAETSHLQMSIKRPEQLEESEDEVSHSDESDNDSPASFTTANTSTISATQYIIDQSARTLRREPRKLTSATLQPKLSMLTLLTSLIPILVRSSLPTTSITSVLIPLQRYTSTTDSAGIPRSADPTFSNTYSTLISSSHEVMETLQTKLGDKEYVQCVTAATKIARAKKLERRNKRNIERVADPEAAARNKRRKAEKGKLRRKEIGHIHRGRRRHDLGF